MPASGITKQPKRVIAKAVERYTAKKARVADLAKELGVSVATMYLWIAADQRDKLERLKLEDMTPKNAAKAEKRDLALRIKELESENGKLRTRVLELMLKHGEL